jgi:NADH-quinone oxidoreductase subunit D
MAMELGAFTPFLWILKAREWLWDILEERDRRARDAQLRRASAAWRRRPPRSFKAAMVRARSREVFKCHRRGRDAAAQEPHLPRPHPGRRHHLQGVARARAGLDRGPVLRSTGVPTTCARTTRTSSTARSTSTCPSARRRQLRPLHVPLRRDAPERAHHRAVPREDARRGPDNNVTDPRIAAPEERGLLDHRGHHQHFKLIMEGVEGAPGRGVLSYTEAATASSASSSSATAAAPLPRARAPPCFFSLQAVKRDDRGRHDRRHHPTFGSINMIGGECDR